jgi:hypothetical protein
MAPTVEQLDQFPSGAPADQDVWFSEVARSLECAPQAWFDEISQSGLGGDRAWALLGWIELAATEVGQSGSDRMLKTAASAMALVLMSDLDRRDCGIVASLLRVASRHAHLNFSALVAAGTEPFGEVGGQALTLMLDADDSLPSTHEEIGSGASFRIRVNNAIDIGRLLDRLKDTSDGQ